MTYPLKFRQHVLSIKVREGLTFAQTAKRFCVGIATLTRWAKRIEPITNVKRPWIKIDIHRLAQDIRDFPDAYHYERARRLGVSARGICDAMKRLGVTYKKKSFTIQRRTSPNGAPSRTRLRLTSNRAGPLFTLTRVASLMTCPALMAIPQRDSLVLAHRIGMRRAEPMLLGLY